LQWIESDTMDNDYGVVVLRISRNSQNVSSLTEILKYHHTDRNPHSQLSSC